MWVHIFVIIRVTKWEVYIKYYVWNILEEIYLCDWVMNETSCFFHGWQRSWLIRPGYFLISECSEPVLLRKNTDSICCPLWNSRFQAKIRILQNLQLLSKSQQNNLYWYRQDYPKVISKEYFIGSILHFCSITLTDA